jgi:hypothetical protein
MSDLDNITYFQKIAADFPKSKNPLRARAKAVELLLIERSRQFRIYGKPVLEVVGERGHLHPIPQSASADLSVSALSPWGDERLRFNRLVRDGIGKNGALSDTHREVNCISSALLVSYGQAQIVLGGDVEQTNWACLLDSGLCPSFAPCVVKVSHHGSSTGKVQGMWSQAGFFGGRGKKPVAVITPWRGELPEMEVIREIQNSGFMVYVTGRNIPSSKVRPLKSFVRIQVEQNGDAQVLEYSTNVEIYPETSNPRP